MEKKSFYAFGKQLTHAQGINGLLFFFFTVTKFNCISTNSWAYKKAIRNLGKSGTCLKNLEDFLKDFKCKSSRFSQNFKIEIYLSQTVSEL